MVLFRKRLRSVRQGRLGIHFEDGKRTYDYQELLPRVMIRFHRHLYRLERVGRHDRIKINKTYHRVIRFGRTWLVYNRGRWEKTTSFKFLFKGRYRTVKQQRGRLIMRYKGRLVLGTFKRFKYFYYNRKVVYVRRWKRKKTYYGFRINGVQQTRRIRYGRQRRLTSKSCM